MSDPWAGGNFQKFSEPGVRLTIGWHPKMSGSERLEFRPVVDAILAWMKKMHVPGAVVQVTGLQRQRSADE